MRLVRCLLLASSSAGCFFSLPDHATPGNADAGAGSGDGAAGTSDGSAPDYPATVRQDGPLAYYRLDDTVGSHVAADTAGHNDGTYDGNARLGAPGLLVGSTDTAVWFDGSSSVHTPIVPAGDFTLEALVRLDAIDPGAGGGGYEAAILSAEKYLTSGFRFGVINDNSLRFWCNESGCPDTANHVSTAAGSIAVGTTHHIAATFAGGAVTLFVDGDRKTAGPVPMMVSTQPLDIASAHGSAYFEGTIDEVAVYPRALPDDRIRAHAVAAGLAR
jgi:hypothetical protein